MTKISKSAKSNAIEKALDILEIFVSFNQEMGTLEISKKLSLNSATVSRIAHTLTNRDFLRQNIQTKKFMLGPRILELGSALMNSLQYNLSEIAKPYLEDLSLMVNEYATFEILLGEKSVVAAQVFLPKSLNINLRVGDTLPINAAAGAKAILANTERNLVNKILSRHKDIFSSLTPKTNVDIDIFLNELDKTKRRGYAMENEEVLLGVNAIAAPVFNYENKPMAAVVIAASTDRMPLPPTKQFISALKTTSKKISEAFLHKKDNEKNIQSK